MQLAKVPSTLNHRRMAMIVYPGCVMLDACGPMDVFAFANFALQLTGQIPPQQYVYSMFLLAERRGPVPTCSGISVFADYGYDDDFGEIDTLLIAGAPVSLDSLKDAKLCAFLNRMQPKVRRIASVCTGAFALAESKILDGRRATTHWLYSDFLAAEYQMVKVEDDKIYIRDGNVYTSGGVTAGMDLALGLVEEDWGRGIANTTARGMLLFTRRPGGQSQFSVYILNEAKTRKDFRELQAWILNNLKADLSVEHLSEKMSMSPRNFSRIFCQEIGMSPARFVERVRLEAARNLIEQSDLPAENIAFNCGFKSSEQMRRSFQRALKITPQKYRENFK